MHVRIYSKAMLAWDYMIYKCIQEIITINCFVNKTREHPEKHYSIVIAAKLVGAYIVNGSIEKIAKYRD